MISHLGGGSLPAPSNCLVCLHHWNSPSTQASRYGEIVSISKTESCLTLLLVHLCVFSLKLLASSPNVVRGNNEEFVRAGQTKQKTPSLILGLYFYTRGYLTASTQQRLCLHRLILITLCAPSYIKRLKNKHGSQLKRSMLQPRGA